jgi:RimJ/RimL family protein N-acetyltransferase
MVGAVRQDGRVQPYALGDGTVRLSVPTTADVDAIAVLCQDPEVGRWTTVPVPYRREDAATFVGTVVRSGWATGGQLAWAVRDATSGEPAGMVSLDMSDGEVGFWLGAPYRRRGWTTRATRLVAASGFERHGLDHLRWRAVVGNEASLRVARRVGFSLEGTVRHSIEQRGVWRDGWVGTLLPGELRH